MLANGQCIFAQEVLELQMKVQELEQQLHSAYDHDAELGSLNLQVHTVAQQPPVVVMG